MNKELPYELTALNKLHSLDKPGWNHIRLSFSKQHCFIHYLYFILFNLRRVSTQYPNHSACICSTSITISWLKGVNQPP
jgi:hypothetical protein